MALGLIIVALLVLGLGLFQAWILWYLKRQVSRLDQRLDESLDDQDLVEFQERLQGLLAQTKDAGFEMVETVNRRQAALEKALEKVREAEAKLNARAQLLQTAADAAAQRAAKLDAETGPKPKGVRSAPKPLPKPKAPLVRELRPAPEAPVIAELPPRARLAEEPPAPTASKHQRIYDLADQGLSRDQIAKEAGVLPGEVELILNLRPKRRGKG